MKNIINIIHGDGVKALDTMEENQYDLAIVDPPYGINRAGQKMSFNPNKRKQNRKKFEDKGWDNGTPDKKYFNDLFYISSNQIIWGGNYFDLPPSKGIIIWDKGQKGLSQSDGELAWSSQGNLRIWVKNRVVLLQEGTIHPTQKPIMLYKWLLKNYAKPGDKIIDNYGGSMSHAIACIDMGFSLDIYEIDADYYSEAVKRIKRHVAQYDFSRPLCEINFIKQ